MGAYLFGGGVNTWVSETKPNVFKEFAKSMVLPADADLSEFAEFTNAEKTAHETMREAWTEPGRDLVDWWNEAFGTYGRYNPETGYFEAYGDLFDITEEQAQVIRVNSYTKPLKDATNAMLASNFYKYHFSSARTFAPLRIHSWISGMNLCFAYQSHIEAIGWLGGYGSYAKSNNWSETFRNCISLRTIATVCKSHNQSVSMTTAFTGCSNLRNVKIECHGNVSVADCKVLSPESVNYMIRNSKNGSTAVTYTYHADVYNQIPDELFVLAEERNITIATP